MQGDEERGGATTLRDWAREARVRSAAYAAQARAAAESAATIGARTDRIIERAAERNPEHAKHLRAIAVTAATQRAAIADRRRALAAGQPIQAIVHDGATDGGLQDTVIQGIFAAAFTLQDAAGRTTEPEARWRIEAAVGGLDELIHRIRGALFTPAHR